MGSVGISVKSESQPSSVKSKKFKLPRKLRDVCDAVTLASVPRKIRSAIKKRGSEFPTIQNRVPNEVGRLRKNVAKKFKLSMNQEQITKDEKEVVETLFELAGMFSDEAKIDKPGLDGESAVEPRSGAEADIGISIQEEECRTICTRATVGAASHLSNSVDRDRVAKFISFDESNNPEFLFGKQSLSACTSSVQPDSCIDRRPKMSTIGAIQSEHTVSLEQVLASEVQYDHEKNSGLFLWPSLSSTLTKSSKAEKSCPRLPVSFKSINCATQHCVTEESANKDKIQTPSAEPKKWRRSSTHAYISHLIKVLQVSERGRLSLEKPNTIMTCGCVDMGMYANTEIQKKTMSIKNARLTSNGNSIIPLAAEKNLAEFQNPSLLHGSLLHEEQIALRTSVSNASVTQGLDVLSLSAESWGLDAYSAEQGTENLKHFHMSQNHPTTRFSLSQRCYSTIHSGAMAVAAQQFPPFLRSIIMAPTGQQWELQEPNWTVPSPVRYSIAGERESTHLNTSLPDLLSNIGSEQQHFPQPQFTVLCNRKHL